MNDTRSLKLQAGIPKSSRTNNILMSYFREKLAYWHVFIKLLLSATQEYLAF